MRPSSRSHQPLSPLSVSDNFRPVVLRRRRSHYFVICIRCRRSPCPPRGYAFDPLSRRLVTVNSMCHLLPVGECQRANAPACSCRSLWISAQIKSSLHSAAVWFYQRKIRRSLLQSAVILSLSLSVSPWCFQASYSSPPPTSHITPCCQCIMMHA